MGCRVSSDPIGLMRIGARRGIQSEDEEGGPALGCTFLCSFFCPFCFSFLFLSFSGGTGSRRPGCPQLALNQA